MYNGPCVYLRLVLTALLNEPSLHDMSVFAPLVGSLPPVQSDSPEARLPLSSARYWAGANMKLNWKPPPNCGDSYQIAWLIRVPNSTRLSPPELPIIDA